MSPWLQAVRRLGRLARLSRRPEPIAHDDAWRAQADPALPEPLAGMLQEVEDAALLAYARHGLPTAPGHYQRGPRARRWTHIPDQLSARERWDLVLDRPTERGFRYAPLEDLGRLEQGASDELIRASRLLAACARIRRAAQGGAHADDLAEALRLGADWAHLRPRMALREAAPLKLTGAQPVRRRRST